MKRSFLFLLSFVFLLSISGCSFSSSTPSILPEEAGETLAESPSSEDEKTTFPPATTDIESAIDVQISPSAGSDVPVEDGVDESVLAPVITYQEFLYEYREKNNIAFDEEDVTYTDPDFMSIPLAPDDQTIHDLVTRIYSDEEIDALIAYGSGLSIQELHEEYPVECLRMKESLDCLYFYASYLGESKLVRFQYTVDGCSTSIPSCYDLQHQSDDFFHIPHKTNFYSIRERFPQPAADYRFYYASSPQRTTASQHYTEDGYVIYVDFQYDDLEGYCVNQVIWELQ